MSTSRTRIARWLTAGFFITSLAIFTGVHLERAGAFDALWSRGTEHIAQDLRTRDDTVRRDVLQEGAQLDAMLANSFADPGSLQRDLLAVSAPSPPAEKSSRPPVAGVYDFGFPPMPGFRSVPSKNWDETTIKMDYATCKKSLEDPLKIRRRPPRRQLKDDLFWLHFPKCGTSFGTALVGMVCQSAESPYANPKNSKEVCKHCGIGPGKSPVNFWDYEIKKLIPFKELNYCNWNVTGEHVYQNHLVSQFERYQQRVGLFRDPRRRLVSAWSDNKHAYGVPTEHRDKFYNVTDTIEKYIASPPIKSCMAKMLLGAPCASHKILTDEDISEAVRRVHRMAFAGLTDAFNASVCLFYHMYEGEMKEWMFSTHARAVESSLFALKDKNAINKAPEQMEFNGLRGPGHRVPKSYWEKIRPDDDPVDWIIYQEAREVFLTNMQEYMLWSPPLAYDYFNYPDDRAQKRRAKMVVPPNTLLKFY